MANYTNNLKDYSKRQLKIIYKLTIAYSSYIFVDIFIYPIKINQVRFIEKNRKVNRKIETSYLSFLV